MRDVIIFALSIGLLNVVACSSESTGTPAAASDTQKTAPIPGSSGSSGSSGAVADASAIADAGADVGADSAPSVDVGPRAYTKAEVQALLDVRCTDCHGGGAPSAGMSLAGDFTIATVGIDSAEVPAMKRISAGAKSKSYLFHKISGTHLSVGGSGLRMPRNGPPYLSDEEVLRIGKFIDAL